MISGGPTKPAQAGNADTLGTGRATAADFDPVGAAAAAQAAAEAASDPVGSAAAAEAASDPVGSAAAAEAASDPVGSAAAVGLPANTPQATGSGDSPSFVEATANSIAVGAALAAMNAGGDGYQGVDSNSAPKFIASNSRASVVTTDGTQTLTNKTMDWNSNTFQNFRIGVSGISGTGSVTLASPGTSGGTWTLPAAGTTLQATGAAVNAGTNSVTGGAGIFSTVRITGTVTATAATFSGSVNMGTNALTAGTATFSGNVTAGTNTITGGNINATNNSSISFFNRMLINATAFQGYGGRVPAVEFYNSYLNLVTDSDGGTIACWATGNAAQDYGATITMGAPYNGATMAAGGRFGVAKENATAGNYSYYMNFATRQSGGNITERMRISSAGVVMIGYTNCASKFGVAGLPTSSAGLVSGDFWNNLGIVSVIT